MVHTSLTKNPQTRQKKQSFPTSSSSGFFALEDQHAKDLSNSSIQTSVRKITEFIRERLSNVSDWKNQDSKDSLLISAIKLRRMNRLSNFRHMLLKQKLTAVQKSVENKFLSLQNVKSEISHLKKAIDGCLEFKSSDFDIELVPIEDFNLLAPKSINKPDVTRNDPHQLHTARLNFELYERKNFLATLHELGGRRNVLLSDIKGKEQRLSQVKPKITAIKETAKPLLDILGLKSVVPLSLDMNIRAKCMPMQLSMVYLNAGVYQEIYGTNALAVSLEGDPNFISSKPYLEFDADQDETQDPLVTYTRSREDDDEFPEKDDDSSNRRLHRRSKECEDSADEDLLATKLQQKREQLLSFHPISVVLEIVKPKLRLKLNYLMELKTVGLICDTSNIESFKTHYSELFNGETFLDDLFDSDSGSVCPSPRSDALLRMIDINIADTVQSLGKQYDFIQSLCGLKFSGGNDCSSDKPAGDLNQFKYFVSVIEKIVRRIETRKYLAQALEDISNSLVPINSISPYLKKKLFPVRTLAALSSFKSINSEDFLNFTGFKNIHKQMVNNLAALNALDNGFLFLASISRENFSLVAHVCIPASYPDLSSTILLTIASLRHNNSPEYLGAIFEVEKYANSHARTLLQDNELSELFPVQLQLIISCLDIALGVVSKRLGTNEFEIHHSVRGISRGRDQQLPCFFDSFANVFNFGNIG